MVHAVPRLVEANDELQQGLLSIEEAARLFSSPDPALRSRGETVFLQLRQSRDALEHALFGLQHSQDPFVQFQSYSIVLERLSSLPLKQPSKSLASLETLRDFLLVLILSQAESLLPQYTRRRSYQALCAVEIRFLGLELETHHRTGHVQDVMEAHSRFILSNVATLLHFPFTSTKSQDTDNKHSMLSAGIGILSTLFDEASSTVSVRVSRAESVPRDDKAPDNQFAGLTPMQHRWVKATIQVYVLQQVMEQVLILTLNIMDQSHSTIIASLPPLIALLERLTRWPFLSNDPFAGLGHLISIDELFRLLEGDVQVDDDDVEVNAAGTGHASSAPVLRQVPASLPAFLSTSLIAHLAKLHSFALHLTQNREVSLCVLKIRRCIITTACYSSSDSSTIQPDVQRTLALLHALESIRSDIDTNRVNMLQSDFCQALLFIMRLFTAAFTVGAAKNSVLQSYGVEQIVETLSKYAHSIFTNAFDYSNDGDDRDDIVSVASEAVHAYLCAWLALLNENDDGNTMNIVRASLASRVVAAYIDHRLDGSVANLLAGVDDDEIGEESVPDFEKFGEELLLVASLARSGDVVVVLTQIIAKLDVTLERLATFYGAPSSTVLGPEESRSLEIEWEKLHWLTLISGHILADDSKGEVADVPEGFRAQGVNEQQMIADTIRKVGIQVPEMFKNSSNDKPQSPQVLQTLLWFNARWIPAYLLATSTPIFSQAFAEEQGRYALACLLGQLGSNLQVWVTDADVVLQVASVIRSFSLSKGVMDVLLSFPQFGNLTEAILQGLGSLPTKTHTPVISSLVGCIYASSSAQDQHHFFSLVTHAIEGRLSAIVHQPNFSSAAVYQRGDVLESLLNALDLFDGLATSVQPRSRRAVYDFLSRFFDTFIHLIDLYKERPEVVTAVLRTVRDLTGALDLGFGVEDDIIKGLIGVVWRMIDSLDSNALIGDSPATSLEDDDPFEGLCLVQELLIELMSSSESDTSEEPPMWFSPLTKEKTSDVCLFGFSRQVPVLRGLVLDISKVRTRFARLCSSLFGLYSHRMMGLVMQEAFTISTSKEETNQCANLFEACLQALSLCLTFDETEASVMCLEAVNTLTQSSRRVLYETQRNSSNTSGVEWKRATDVLSNSFLRLLDTVLRALLIEPLSPSLFNSFVQSFQDVIQAVANISPDTSQHNLQQHLQYFCATTRLHSVRTAKPSHYDDAQRRPMFAQIVAELCQLSMAQGEDPQKLAQLRELSWKGRTALHLG